MTRIIGGAAKGRRLRTPRGEATRPTSDRVREALFSAIESWCGSLAGLRVLDLYAGSGAVGLEAASRGAAEVTLVERDRRTARLIAANARALGFGPEVRVVAEGVRAVLARRPEAPYDVIFADPPYPQPDAEVDSDLAALAGSGWLVPGGLVVLERASRSRPPTWPRGLREVKQRRYGETALWFGQESDEEAVG